MRPWCDADIEVLRRCVGEWSESLVVFDTKLHLTHRVDGLCRFGHDEKVICAVWMGPLAWSLGSFTVTTTWHAHTIHCTEQETGDSPLG